MVIIADSGSTKTDWSLLHPSGGTAPRSSGGDIIATPATQPSTLPPAVIHTPGINPVHQSTADIRATLPVLETVPEAVYFYGAGCTPDRIPLMEQLLREHFRAQRVEVQSDLMGAARALCGRAEGMACILGTGANSCLYDGERIVQNTPALGYILGDEGSGAVLGRRFLNAIFKRPDMADVRDDYLATVQLTQADIISRVYRQPMANRFLASTSLYIGQHLDRPELHRLVVDNFRQFFRCNLLPYGRQDLPVGVVGSMGHHYRRQLAEAARLEGFTLGTVVKSPMEGLLAYHQGVSG